MVNIKAGANTPAILLNPQAVPSARDLYIVEYDSTTKGLNARNVTLAKNLKAVNPRIKYIFSQYQITNRHRDEITLPIRTIGFLPKSSM